ncbi:hypothetical protein SAMN04487926_119102 [Paraburkholderia steynii]|uniref:Uncharacterized protein n=1 Tax=Paraburkholderia steynii TaxID=1245441 RepID=A0A7Z7FJK1_9BURK|nr:hypothetical protein SAMN04487926_119102 [Paraburkholderia steynii]
MPNKEANATCKADMPSFQLARIALLSVLAVGGTLASVTVWWQLCSIGRSLVGIRGTLSEVSQSIDLTWGIAVTSRNEIGHNQRF